ncbi:MAG TPA: ATP-binding cassette domain-containing protein, partial [Streptosporangiaceae bacterium]|nr:ATP-binding cassette domain-containing protein [Streptosporangiaceae bacterium]
MTASPRTASSRPGSYSAGSHSPDSRGASEPGPDGRGLAQRTIPPLLEIRDLSVSFGLVQALTGVGLTLQEGEVVALAGENGAGKTTLVRCIGGDIAPNSGDIRIGGLPVQ